MTVTGELSHTILTGPPAPERFLPLEEIVRPFAAAGRRIVFRDGATRLELSYAELAGRTAHAAARLRQAGVGPGEPVAMTLANDLGSVLALLATWACGGTVVSLPPVPPKDNGWHARQFDPVLAAMGCTFRVSDAAAGDETGVPGQRTLVQQELAAPASGRAVLPDLTVPDTALIQFTSGSVSTPKGIAIGSRALAGHCAAVSASLDYDAETDRSASWLPLYHDMGLVVMFLGSLAARVDQVVASPHGFALNPGSWLTMLATERATTTAAPNFAFRLAATVPYRDQLDLSRLRVLLNGGERVGWQTLLDFHAAAGPMGCSWEALSPCYGLAEGTVGVTVSLPGRAPRRGPDGHVSAGTPLPGVELRLPAGSLPGPVEMRSPWCLSGYYTARGFEPVAAGEWFDTTDGGFARDGELYVLGRRNEVLSSAGHNIFAEDVETVIHEACGESVRACAAFRQGDPGRPGDTGRFAVLAEVNPRLVRGPEAALELARLIQTAVSETVGTRLSPVLVTRLGSIPRTSSGKVQRAKCRSLVQNGQISRRLIAELA
jgi:fatty-acyl-CoA synthase